MTNNERELGVLQANMDNITKKVDNLEKKLESVEFKVDAIKVESIELRTMIQTYARLAMLIGPILFALIMAIVKMVFNYLAGVPIISLS